MITDPAVLPEEPTPPVTEPPVLHDHVYTVAEAARILKVRTDKCYDLVREGSLGSIHISSRNIRIPGTALERFINGGSTEG